MQRYKKSAIIHIIFALLTFTLLSAFGSNPTSNTTGGLILLNKTSVRTWKELQTSQNGLMALIRGR